MIWDALKSLALGLCVVGAVVGFGWLLISESVVRYYLLGVLALIVCWAIGHAIRHDEPDGEDWDLW